MTYIHGTEAAEQSRLAALNDWMNDAYLREAAIAPGERVVDFGCGLGHLACRFALCARAPGRVVAFDSSAEQLAGARRAAGASRPCPEFREGDVLDPPLKDEEWGTFDVAHARFVLEHVRDPLAVVRQMVRTLRPGGRLVLADDDHAMLTLNPGCPEFSTLWVAYMRTYELIGADPLVGRRLPTLLAEAGATPERTALVDFGSCAGSPTFSVAVSNLAGVIDTARDRMIESGLVSAEAYGRAMSALRAWATLPDATIWYAISFAQGRVP
ncbi:MAG: methyltransferase domain-containing protein [Phycisphaerales bacterium]|nr:methyltransferase domain-containing protein [Phycisphaerales bacterium]